MCMETEIATSFISSLRGLTKFAKEKKGNEKASGNDYQRAKFVMFRLLFLPGDRNVGHLKATPCRSSIGQTAQTWQPLTCVLHIRRTLSER